MPTANKPQLLNFHNWIFRLRPAQKIPARLLVMLHGWTGDENSMLIFVRNLSQEYTIVTPRAPFTASGGGYSWRDASPASWGLSSVADLRPVADSLLAFLDDWADSTSMDATCFDLVGFSQGAAVAYTLTMLYSDRVHRLAALSGFLPSSADVLSAARPWSGKTIFVAHGRQDELIPVEHARRTVSLLKASGAQVTYCENDEGHKISADCLRAVESFFLMVV